MAHKKPPSISLKAAIAEAVKARRAELGLSQEEIAERAGLDRTYVSGVERQRRNITIETLARLAAALSLTSAEFLKKVLIRLE
jgi:transcriptional regulator with XRE-family HTH domain